jgi:shikimate kinase
MKAKAFAAGTVLNALALGVGSAFGLKLTTTVKVKEDDETVVVVNGKEIKSPISERILKIFGKNAYIEVNSEIPSGSGLGSSSAYVNALLCALLKERGERLEAYRILSANARLSLEMGISYTGAFDDAAASLLGGFVISNNNKLKLYRWDRAKFCAAVLIPMFGRGKVDMRSIRSDASRIEHAIPRLLGGSYCEVMKVNTLYYCEKLGYPTDIAEKGWNIGICCGLSGNGPTFVAFGSKKDMREICSIWKEYGDVILTEVAEKPSEEVIIGEELFFRENL